MPTNLNKLKVSLTKFGSHKIAYLVSRFDKDDILNHISGDYNSINVDRAQASKILSIDRHGTAPELWNQLKQYGEEDIFDIVFISNVLSHIDLINAMSRGIEEGCVIKRGSVISGKAYTNFAHTIHQFGYSIKHTPDFISFDISRIFYKFYLSKFVFEIIKIKLTEAGWDAKNSIIKECHNLDLNNVFGLSTDDFDTWLEGNIEVDETKLKKVKANRDFEKGINFRKGHNTKYEGRIEVKSFGKHTATLLHNKIQNKVYEILKRDFPDDEIGTEVPSNTGSIDIVKKRKDDLTFYEIKTTGNVRTNIRQALSQLLEYAYWNRIEGIEQLIIVSPSQPSPEAIGYLEVLRNKFNMPVYYQSFNIKDGTLSNPV